MRILVLADVESKSLWDYFNPEYVKDVDLILAAGDLKASYLEFLVTLCNLPLVYVPGNHDKAYLVNPPEGCINADGKVIDIHGLRIAGLGGCYCYNKGPYQYTERQMFLRTLKLRVSILLHHGADILLTHAPAYNLGDAEDLAHIGFKSFVRLLDRFSPCLMVHGHVHMNYGMKIKREIQYKNTRIVNAYEKYIIEIDDEALKTHKKNGKR